MKPGAWEAAQEGIFKQLEELQGDKCGICGRDDMGSLCVDHDHDSGLIRGLLCGRCNTVEGQHGRLSPHVWTECAVCAWRKYPAVSWLRWTVSYDVAPGAILTAAGRYKPIQPLIDEHVAYEADVMSRMFTGDGAA